MIDLNQPPLSYKVVKYLGNKEYDTFKELNEKTLGQILVEKETCSELMNMIMNIRRVAIIKEDSTTRDYCTELALYIKNR